MAEIISYTPKKRGAKRLSTRIDLTPMVDLGFLLITFFIITTTLLQPNVMDIIMPNEEPTAKPSIIPDYASLKLFIGKNHELYYLRGEEAAKDNFQAMEKIGKVGTKEIRTVLNNLNARVRYGIASGLKGSKASDKSFVIIKPTSRADYSDIVSVLDEMSICDIGNYALVDLEEKEKNFFKD